jgi:putative membrane protein
LIIQESQRINIAGLIIGILFSAVISGTLIWIEGWLGLGLTVDGPIPAFLAGFAMAVVGGVVTWLLSLRGIKITNGLLRAVINVLLGAVVLLIAGQFIAGFSVDGFLGALLASAAIGVVSWLLSLILRRVNQAAAREQETGQLP